MSVRIGIMGGTMDPIHNGHIAIAQMVKEQMHLDDMMLLPAGDPPHKTPQVDKWHRLAMVRLAAKESGFQVNDVEILRKKVTYTVDTLQDYAWYHPDAEIIYVVGGDTVSKLEQWRNFPMVARLCEFAVVARPGDEQLQEIMAGVTERTGAKFTVIDGVGPDISSTRVREMAAKGEDIAQVVPASVAEYIEKRALYREMSIDEMHKRLAEKLSEKRLIHSIGVMETAVRLAAAAGADVEKARIAGLLHDCAKALDDRQAVDVCELGGIELYPAEKKMHFLKHAPAGMALARHNYGISDPEILGAIRKHTTGAAEMSPLDLVIYVADFIEPNRKPIPGLEQIRAVAEQDIRQAARMCAESTKAYVLKNNWLFCPQTQEMLDALNQ